MRWTAPTRRHHFVPIRESNSPVARAILAFAEGLELAEGVEKLFLDVPNERLIRDIALRRNSDSMR